MSYFVRSMAVDPDPEFLAEVEAEVAENPAKREDARQDFGR